MTALANVSELLNRLSGGNNGNPENVFFHKIGGALTTTPTSAWRWDGYPAAGAIPTAAAVPTAATQGALKHTNPGGGRQRWLRSLQAIAFSAGRIILYDRLLHCGGLSGTVTTAQTVGGAITRYTGQASLGNFAMVEVYSGIGGTATTVSCNYLDKDGISRLSPSVPIGGTSGFAAGLCAILPYNVTTGANSVTSVVDVTLAGTTGTAGNFGVTICRPLLELQIGGVSPSDGTGARVLALEDIELKTDACLALLSASASNTLATLRGRYMTLER